METKFYNLIILDKSGSMESIRDAAIAGVNETLGTIRKIGRETDSEQRVSLMTFCGCEKTYLIRNQKIEDVEPITRNTYQPCCGTPLYDAIGKACTGLKKHVKADEHTKVSVTIITDGYENMSREWTAHSVKALIEGLKAEGWLFAFIGANIDVTQVSFSLSIENSLSFTASEQGTSEMFARERSARSRWAKRACSEPTADMDACNADYFGE